MSKYININGTILSQHQYIFLINKIDEFIKKNILYETFIMNRPVYKIKMEKINKPKFLLEIIDIMNIINNGFGQVNIKDMPINSKILLNFLKELFGEYNNIKVIDNNKELILLDNSYINYNLIVKIN